MYYKYVVYHYVSYAHFDIPFLHHIKTKMECLSSNAFKYIQQRNSATFWLDR